jgi:hypothetical protein
LSYPGFAATDIQFKGSINILIVNSAPRKSALGATNGLAQALGSFTRSIGPSIAASLFAFSIEKNIAGGNLVYFVLCGLALCGFRLTFYLPEEQHVKK